MRLKIFISSAIAAIINPYPGACLETQYIIVAKPTPRNPVKNQLNPCRTVSILIFAI